jgi:dipeptidyl aminopeptidase/acylaminoacyl peptidase
MSRFLSIAMLSACALTPGALADDTKAIKKYDARTFYDTTTYTGASFSADGSRLLLSSNADGVFNVYSQPVAGGAPQQLTSSKTSAAFAQEYFPHDDRFIYTQDQGGNELNHIYVHEPDGKLHDLTPGKNGKSMFAGWAADLKHFFVLSNERDRRFFDLYRYDADKYERTLLFKNTDGYGPGTISRNGRWVVVTKERTNADNDLFLWDAEQPDKNPVKITDHQGDVQHQPQTFSVDASVLYYTSNEGSEYQRVWAYDLKTKERKLFLSDNWDVSNISFSWNGRYRVTSVNADARTVTTVTDTQTGKPVLPGDLTGIDIGGVDFSRDETQMAFYGQSDISPADLYVLDLRTGKHRKLTRSLSPKIHAEDLVHSTVVRYPSFDDLKIPALLYQPQGASATSKVPALVWVHGGPGGQSRAGYNAVIQFLANHGYAVLAVNNRGSSGYGKTFFHMDDRRHGDVDLQDVVYGRRYLESLDWVDGGRVGVMGGSYGGYMVCACLAFAPDAFNVGIDIFGVTNWLRTLESIPPWWASFRNSLYAELGDPKTDRERLQKISPLFHAKNIRKPMLVIQGANDPRVLKVESDEMVKAVRDNGVPVEYVIFPDEGHGFLRKENQITAAEAYLKFLDRHLKGT